VFGGFLGSFLPFSVEKVFTDRLWDLQTTSTVLSFLKRRGSDLNPDPLTFLTRALASFKGGLVLIRKVSNDLTGRREWGDWQLPIPLRTPSGVLRTFPETDYLNAIAT